MKRIINVSVLLALFIILIMTFLPGCAGRNELSSLVPSQTPTKLQPTVNNEPTLATIPTQTLPPHGNCALIIHIETWIDNNENGQKDFGEPPLGNVLLHVGSSKKAIGISTKRLISDHNGQTEVSLPVLCKYIENHEIEVIASGLIGFEYTTPMSQVSTGHDFSFGLIYSNEITPTPRPEFLIDCKKWDLPYSTYVTDIEIDLEKSIWVATNNGLVYKYSPDGTFEVVYTSDNGIGDDVIRGITLDLFNNFWFATNSGVSKYDGNSWEYYTSNEGLPDDYYRHVNDIEISPTGDLWVSSPEGYGIFDYFNDIWIVVRPDDYIGLLPSRSIIWAQDGSGWFTTHNSLIQLVNPENTNGDYQWIIHKSGYSDNNVPLVELSDSTLAPDGTIWFSGENEAGPVIGGYNPLVNTWEIHSYFSTNQAMIGDSVIEIASSPDGSLWVGTRKRGLIHFVPGQSSIEDVWIIYTKQNGMPYDGIYKLFVEDERTLWLSYDTSISRCKVNE